MLIKNVVIIGLTASLLFGCKGNDTAAVVVGLNLPANIAVLQDDSAVTSNLAAVNAAFNDAGTDYTKSKGDVFVDGGEWGEPLDMADFLACVMTGTGSSLIPNGTYKALINMTQCDNETEGSQQGKKTNFADAVVISSRASNTAAQNITAYLIDGDDNNNDGDIADAGESMNIVIKASITESASTSNPFGAFTFDYNQTNSPTGSYMRGSLAISNEANDQVGMSLISQSKEGSDLDNIWSKGLLNKDATAGKMKVVIQIDGDEDGLFAEDEITTNLVNFNATHVNISTNGAAICKDLSEASMTEYVYSYGLFDSTTGALKDITAGLEFVYGNGTDSTLRGYAGSYIDSTEAVQHWIWTETGLLPGTPIYKESDTSVSYAVAYDGAGLPTITGMTFDPRVEINADFTGITPTGTSGTKTDNLDYEGPGQLWGINWSRTGDTNNDGQCDAGENDCDSDNQNWSPNYNIADGTSLTDTNGTVWKVKQMGSWKTLATVDASNCSTIPATDAAVSFTAPTLSAVTTTWASQPAITAKPRVVSGKEI